MSTQQYLSGGYFKIYDLNRKRSRSPQPETIQMKLPEETLTIFEESKPHQPDSPPRLVLLPMQPKQRKQRTPGQKGKESDLVLHEPTRKLPRTTKKKQLVDANKPTKATRKKAEQKLVISEDPMPIDTRPRKEKPFDCRIAPKFLHKTGCKTIRLDNEVPDFTEEDAVAILNLPYGPKKLEQFSPNEWDYPKYVEHVDAWRKMMDHNGLPVLKSKAADILSTQED
ncbi:OLC1v1029846C1 [Oldenlandia corymbosa var. corymbosa]|uniref:OLC1v1029846C1 n=1 Tax=Oldenlandia corymbosa var. corymbosa TaxID=529605 RepID=A0AAV1CFH3_OLDCO|nr:OLC1v1029846C1 [Oldenlandia corymbosa var. corymbosa]